MRALADAIRAFLSRLVTVTRWVGGRLVTTTQAVIEAVPAVASGVVHAADAVISSPFRLAGRALGMLARRGGPAPTEQSVDQRSAHAEQAIQHQASERTEHRQLMRAVRSLALARADGGEPDAALLASMPAEVATYVMSLDTSECRALSTRSSSDVRGLLDGTLALSGIRTPRQVLASPARERVSFEPQVVDADNAYAVVSRGMQAA